MNEQRLHNPQYSIGYMVLGVVMVLLLSMFLYIWRLNTEFDQTLKLREMQAWSVYTAERSLAKSILTYARYYGMAGDISRNDVSTSYQEYLNDLDILDPEKTDLSMFEASGLQSHYNDLYERSMRLGDIVLSADPIPREQHEDIYLQFERLEQYFYGFTSIALGADYYQMQRVHFTDSRRTLYITLCIMLVCILFMVILVRRQSLLSQRVTQQFFEAQKMEALGQLAGGIAHDFNNTLAAIQGYADFLQEDLKDQPEQKSFAGNISIAAQDAKELVKQILAYSRKSQATYSQTSLADVLTNISTLAQATLPTGVELRLNIQIDRDICIRANVTQLNQVFMNLFVNAADAIEHKEGQIDVSFYEPRLDHPDLLQLTQSSANTIKVEKIDKATAKLYVGQALPDRAHIAVKVSDNGVGIDRNKLKDIFKPFFSTKENVKGTGLGLAAVQGIVAEHKGAMVVVSTIGEGSTFKIYFPIDTRAEKNSDKKTRTISDTESSTPKKGHIMLVEDDMLVANVTSKMLERAGYDVIHCIDAIEAQEILSSGDLPDLILTDYKMPRMNGAEFAKALKSTHPEIPVVMHTGHADTSKADLQKIDNIEAVIEKPSTQKELQNQIHRILSRTD